MGLSRGWRWASDAVKKQIGADRHESARRADRGNSGRAIGAGTRDTDCCLCTARAANGVAGKYGGLLGFVRLNLVRVKRGCVLGRFGMGIGWVSFPILSAGDRHEQTKGY